MAPGIDTVPPRVRTQGDRETMDDFRVLWIRYGREAGETLWSLFEGAHRRVHGRRAGFHRTEARSPKVSEIRRAFDAMDHAVSSQSNMTVEELQAAFEAFFDKYLAALKWIARLRSHGELTLDDLEVSEFERWKGQHNEFQQRLLDLRERPRYRGRLRTARTIFAGDQQLADLLMEVETGPGTAVIDPAIADTSPGPERGARVPQ
jgi:hypothetical protein